MPDHDEEIFKPKTETEDIFIDDDDITMQLPEMEVDGKTEIEPADTEIEVDVYDDGSKIILNKTKGTEKIKI